MARTGKTSLKIKNNGVLIGSSFDTLDLLTGISAIDEGNGSAGVTSTGSAQGYQQPVSGVVNGTNQIFTWATAPSVIVVDQGRPMQKVSSDGTVNWTGTTTTTVAVAPNSDIFATA